MKTISYYNIKPKFGEHEQHRQTGKTTQSVVNANALAKQIDDVYFVTYDHRRIKHIKETYSIDESITFMSYHDIKHQVFRGIPFGLIVVDELTNKQMYEIGPELAMYGIVVSRFWTEYELEQDRKPEKPPKLDVDALSKLLATRTKKESNDLTLDNAFIALNLLESCRFVKRTNLRTNVTIDVVFSNDVTNSFTTLNAIREALDDIRKDAASFDPY